MVLNVSAAGHFTELARLASAARATFRAVFQFTRQYEALGRDVEICRSQGYEFVAPPITDNPIARPTPAALRRSLMPSIVWRSAPYLFRQLLAELLLARRYTKMFRQLARDQNVSILIMCEDNPGYGTQYLIRSADRLGIPSVILPYSIVTALEPAEAYCENTSYTFDNAICRIVGTLFPRWAYEHRGKRLLRLPPPLILANELLRTAPPRPWTHNSGYADALFVENPHMLEHYRREGLPEHQLVMTGAVYDDILAEALAHCTRLREELYTETALPPDRPLLLCALPPSQFPRRACEFADYESLVAAWLGELQQVKGWNVLVRLHPRVQASGLIGHQTDTVKFTDRDTASLVPLCDLYVASVSATIRWAVACGKPVINYDVYRFCYDDYASATGVITMSSLEDFRAQLRRLTLDTQALAAVTHDQEQCMTAWGNTDGRSGERIIQAMRSLVNGRAGTAKKRG